MATVAQTTTHRNLTPNRSHRRAFGAQRPTTPAQRAQYIAESITLRQDEGRAWTYEDYGIGENPLMQRLVEAALAKLRWTADEEERLAAYFYEQEQAYLEEMDRHYAEEDGH
jgi:hypothetical protein